jgi:hypothetical protein
MARELGWSPGQQKDAVDDYVSDIDRLMEMIGLRSPGSRSESEG